MKLRPAPAAACGLARPAGLLLAFACALCALPARADEALRADIAAQRQLINQRFAAEEQACQLRFAVTACVDDARTVQRQALAPLRSREAALDEAERQQRAEERRSAVAAKQRAQQESGRAASAAGELPSVAPPPPRERPAPRQPHARPARARDNGAQEAAKRVQAAQSRASEAAAAQARVANRLAQRQAAGKVAQPLPVPAGAAPAPGMAASSASAAARKPASTAPKQP
jgi:colicin import membrane protein